MMGPGSGVSSSFPRGPGRRSGSDRLLATRISAGRVLIVDDEEDLRESIAELLTDEGFDVQIAEDGRDALAQLADIQRPCHVLLDLYMPGMSGFAFLDALAEDEDAAEDVHVVVMTSAPRQAPDDVEVIKKPASAGAVLAALAH
jgi:CheY-like chemotaxis protein